MKKMTAVSQFNPTNVCGGLLAGLVSLTAPCNNIEIYSALVIGIVGGLWYILGCIIMFKLKIDDPVEAS